MCGRYVAVSTPEELAEAFDVADVRAESQGQRFNVAPTVPVYAVIARERRRRLGTMRWGFVPHWAKSPTGRAPINARIETIDTNGMFRRSVRERRCILPADGFYEWQDRDGFDTRQPWYVHDPDHRPLAFAGIWTVWRDRGDPDADWSSSCAIVTTAAAGRMRDLHDRMPVMLPDTLHDDWLHADPDDAPHLLRAVRALGAPALRAHTVSTRVNNVRNDAPDLVDQAPPMSD